MARGAHLEGPALRALAARADAPSFPLPGDAFALPAPTAKARDRIWELADTLHCSIVGTCLTNADARALLAKLGVPDARSMSEHRLHGRVVQIAGRRDGGAKLLQKMLDRRHEREIRQFDAAGTVEAVRELWRASLDRGEIPGAYWAAITHPATDWALVQDIFGEVHMLSHLVGQSNRADIRRLRALETDLAARDARLGEQEHRIAELVAGRDALATQARAVAISCAPPPAPRAWHETTARAALRRLADRLMRERSHAAALEEKLAVLTQATTRLGRDLEAETALRHRLEAELAAAEAVLADDPVENADAEASGLDGRTLLYVGGRPRQVANLRRLAARRGGHLLCHDGGIEDSLSLLPGLVGQADFALFPVACISHEAVSLLKRACEATGTTFKPLRSASLASFVQATLPTRPAR